MVLRLLVLLAIASRVAADGWRYDGKNGPSSWAKHYEECGGEYQSPIDLTTKNTVKISKALKWTNRKEPPQKMVLQNIADTVALTGTWSEGQQPALDVTMGSQSAHYLIDSTQFHWGRGPNNGTEHTLNGERKDLEMQTIMKQAVKNNPFPETAIYSMLFSIGEDITTPGIHEVAQKLTSIPEPFASVELEPFGIDNLIPRSKKHTFLYQGSLTSPPCSGSVLWIIPNRVYDIKSKDLEMFRTLKNYDKEDMSGNIRPTQPLNGRSVFLDSP